MEYVQEVKVKANQMFKILEKSFQEDIFRTTGKKNISLTSGYSYMKNLRKTQMTIRIDQFIVNKCIACTYSFEDKEIVSSYTLLPNGDESCKVIYTEVVNTKENKEIKGIEKWISERRFRKTSKKYISGVEKFILKGQGA